MTSFTLNEEAAREWVTGLIMTRELAYPDSCRDLSASTAMPQLGMDWLPREPGQEDTIASLVRCAQTQPGVLTAADDAEVAIEFVDDGDDWSYHFLLHIRVPAPVTLASPHKEVRQIGQDAVFGIEAAIGILREATRTAAALRRQLDAFVEAVTRDA